MHIENCLTPSIFYRFLCIPYAALSVCQFIYQRNQAFADSAEDAIHTIDCLAALHDKNIKLFDSFTKRQRNSVLKIFTYLEANPIIAIQKTADALEMSYNTVSKAVSILVDDGVAEQTGKSGKAKIYSYTEYLNVLRKGT